MHFVFLDLSSVCLSLSAAGMACPIHSSCVLWISSLSAACSVLYFRRDGPQWYHRAGSWPPKQGQRKRYPAWSSVASATCLGCSGDPPYSPLRYAYLPWPGLNWTDWVQRKTIRVFIIITIISVCFEFVRYSCRWLEDPLNIDLKPAELHRHFLH